MQQEYEADTSMDRRPFWRGYLKLSLVTCPVAMTPALSEAEKIRFHTLNRATGNRIESRYIYAVTDKPVDEDDLVKGYQSGEDKYVMLEDEEIEAVALESTRTIDIDEFVPRDSIDWIWYDRPHYLLPDDPVGEEAFAVIRQAMADAEVVGISRLVLYRRERAVMLEPRDRGIVLWTLRYGDEVRDPDAYFNSIKSEKSDAHLTSLINELIGQRTKPWSPAMVGDPVEGRLAEVIAAKEAGKKAPKAKAVADRPSNVIDIMDALRKSVALRKSPSKRR
jgi:DNA end-binding protein Ku